MNKYAEKTTTELFNIFHDEYKDVIASLGPDCIPDSPHWCREFRFISGISKEDTDNCYWHNIEIPNNEEANAKLVAYLEKIDNGEEVITAEGLFVDIMNRYGTFEYKDGKYFFKAEYKNPVAGCLDWEDYIVGICEEEPDEHYYTDEQIDYLKRLAKSIEKEDVA